ncbi:MULTISPECIES: helix-turn-helix transcriptional regulator [Agrobacterium tumefaciens complex]|uniref:helix-turn-helix transcriptional regulator n=1 Tax=Agrobacterium tumefaciens TaxID=358 RepID=UPI000FE286F1|nr:helix-turn-helix transcriptional regulator [Agrobacterium tumefaciens]QAA98966.1 LuxR family transcriptional regulator [Agrobacterium tumefaciens]QAB01185.1 LuxR family transcriptional regulator [Agrobacterium tumefaciens]
METCIRDITSEELHLYGSIIGRLAELDSDVDARNSVFTDIVKLVRADFAASYVWNDQSRRFEKGLIHNMDPDNIKKYERYYQFRDPHTFKLRQKRCATLIEEVNPYSELVRTEFYNDFLKRDGLHHGINIFIFDGDRDIGDFRLWRAEKSPDFSQREKLLLDNIAPFLKRAMSRNIDRFEGLTPREREIAFLVTKGCRDREIGEMLEISFSTVRTHLNKAMEKRGCANRAELAALIMQEKRIG